MRTLRYLSHVSSLTFEPQRCVGCRMCLTVCPQGVWRFADKRAAIGDRDACMECSACANNCASRAIEVRRGVGCANAILKSAFGSKTNECC